MYDSISNFIFRERLPWVPSRFRPNEEGSGLETQGRTPFAHNVDYKILRNDWPYAASEDVAHLVVWVKTPFITGNEGHLLLESRSQIETFVHSTFKVPLKSTYGVNSRERVLWFRSWSALQSVSALEHSQRFVRGTEEDLLEEWTGETKRLVMYKENLEDEES